MISSLTIATVTQTIKETKTAPTLISLHTSSCSSAGSSSSAPQQTMYEHARWRKSLPQNPHQNPSSNDPSPSHLFPSVTFYSLVTLCFFSFHNLFFFSFSSFCHEMYITYRQYHQKALSGVDAGIFFVVVFGHCFYLCKFLRSFSRFSLKAFTNSLLTWEPTKRN